VKFADFAKQLEAQLEVPPVGSYREARVLVRATELLLPQLGAAWPLAQQLLTLCSFWAPNAIPLDAIRTHPQSLPAGLAEMVSTPEVFHEYAVLPLLRYSLARREGDNLFLHQVVQDAVRETLGEEDLRAWVTIAIDLIDATLPFVGRDTLEPAKSATYDRLVPHALSATDHAKCADVAYKPAWQVLNKIGEYLRIRGDQSGARLALERAREYGDKLALTDSADASVRDSKLASNGKLRQDREQQARYAIQSAPPSLTDATAEESSPNKSMVYQVGGFQGLEQIIKPEHVMANLRASGKKQVLQELARRSADITGQSERTIFSVLMKRERLGTTGVGNGIALPHGKLPTLNQLHGLFARLEQPIDFESIDDRPVDLIFLLLAPESSGNDHLKALARCSRLLRNKAVCEDLRATEDSKVLYSLLIDSAATMAA